MLRICLQGQKWERGLLQRLWRERWLSSLCMYLSLKVRAGTLQLAATPKTEWKPARDFEPANLEGKWRRKNLPQHMTGTVEQQWKLSYFLDLKHLPLWKASRRGQGAVLQHSLSKMVLAGLLSPCRLSRADSFLKQLPTPSSRSSQRANLVSYVIKITNFKAFMASKKFLVLLEVN